MKRLIGSLAIWYILIAGAMMAGILLDRGTPMQGPLLPGQERPVYYGD